MKIAPFIRAIKEYNSNPSLTVKPANQSTNLPINHLLVHTGQHYDDRMSKAFLHQC